MKTSLLFGATLAILGVAIVSMSAQTQSTTYVQTSKLVGTKVKSSQGEEIGEIKDVVLDRNTGCMAYTVLSAAAGGARATGGGKLVAVPWAVYSPTADLSVLSVTVDRDRLYNGPVFDYARINEYSTTGYINNVYSYYGVSPGAGAGAAATTTGAATRAGAAGSPGATTSPAGTGSPGAMRSPAATASPAGRASPSPRATAAASPRATAPTRPYATASPSREGAETATPTGRGERGTRGRPEATASPGGGRETTSPPEAQGAPSEGGSPGERTRTSRHHGKPAGSPSEKPPQEQE
jgi:sporulation protein YlmC with PRC-barrel domain